MRGYIEGMHNKFADWWFAFEYNATTWFGDGAKGSDPCLFGGIRKTKCGDRPAITEREENTVTFAGSVPVNCNFRCADAAVERQRMKHRVRAELRARREDQKPVGQGFHTVLLFGQLLNTVTAGKIADMRIDQWQINGIRPH